METIDLVRKRENIEMKTTFELEVIMGIATSRRTYDPATGLCDSKTVKTEHKTVPRLYKVKPHYVAHEVFEEAGVNVNGWQRRGPKVMQNF